MAACSDTATQSTPSVDPERRYVEFMRENISGAVDKSDSELIAGGMALCAELEGKTVDDLAVIAVIFGYDIAEFGFALTGAINTSVPSTITCSASGPKR